MELNDKRKVIAYSPTIFAAALILLSPFIELFGIFDKSLSIFHIQYYVAFSYAGVFIIFLSLKNHKPQLISYINLYLIFSLTFSISHANTLWILAVNNESSKGVISKIFEDALGSQFIIEQKENMINIASLDAFYISAALIFLLFITSKWATYVVLKNCGEKIDFYEFLVRGIFNFSVKKFIAYLAIIAFLIFFAEDLGPYVAAPNDTNTLTGAYFD